MIRLAYRSLFAVIKVIVHSSLSMSVHQHAIQDECPFHMCTCSERYMLAGWLAMARLGIHPWQCSQSSVPTRVFTYVLLYKCMCACACVCDACVQCAIWTGSQHWKTDRCGSRARCHILVMASQHNRTDWMGLDVCTHDLETCSLSTRTRGGGRSQGGGLDGRRVGVIAGLACICDANTAMI